ncbi:hypothetical protein PoB_007422000 [Plakobranchus ocellatus]|uniref:Uncharacterized protein n=1 Tax=Plakobranchus ocellatus TaxID=259542 RepID=A0AAV4DUJ5_9GAST|nr:hypothetical protein PoB_007422000 [Plakobranchus ocellatus]
MLPVCENIERTEVWKDRRGRKEGRREEVKEERRESLKAEHANDSAWKVKARIVTQDNVNPQQDDPTLLGPPSGQSANGGARNSDRRIPADLRADSLTTEPLTPRSKYIKNPQHAWLQLLLRDPTVTFYVWSG